MSGKYKNGALPEGARYTLWGKDRMKQNFNQNTLAASEKYENLADKLGITPSQLAISWVNDREFVHSNIIGATTMQQLKEDIDAADIILSPETRKEIDTIFTQMPNPATF